MAAVMDKATGQFVPKIKLSENAEKITNPGNKTIQRIYDKATGKIIADLICLVGEEFDTRNSLLLFDPLETWKKTMLAPDSYTMRELMIPIFLDGRCVYQSPKVMDIQAYCKKELDTLWDESKRLINPHTVHVDLSNELWHTKNQLLDSFHRKINRHRRAKGRNHLRPLLISHLIPLSCQCSRKVFPAPLNPAITRRGRTFWGRSYMTISAFSSRGLGIRWIITIFLPWKYRM